MIMKRKIPLYTVFYMEQFTGPCQKPGLFILFQILFIQEPPCPFHAFRHTVTNARQASSFT